MVIPARSRLRSLIIAAMCLVTAMVGVPTAAADGAGAGAAPAGSWCRRSAVDTEAESALLSRTIGLAADQVCFQVAPAAGPETFTISGTPGRIDIRASSLSAASEGAGWYLKYVAHADEGLGDFHPNVPRILPAPPETITQSSNATNRYEGNDTEDGYTNPYMSWPQWQNILDMYALHGINQVYVLPGTDAVYEKVLQDYGYTADQARAWIPLSGTQPWWVMQNVSNDTAPIPQTLLDADAALARKIVERCKQLGITGPTSPTSTTAAGSRSTPTGRPSGRLQLTSRSAAPTSAAPRAMSGSTSTPD